VIPRILCQTGPPETPLLLESAMQTVRLLNPDFEYKFYSDAAVNAFFEEDFPEYRGIFDSFPHRIQRYDFFRYLAIYRHGGFYLDQDVFLARGLEPLVQADCVFCFEELSPVRYLWDQFGLDWQIGNYGFGAAPGHPFMAALIENCIRAQQDPNWVKPLMKGIPRPFHNQFYILNTTGPGMVTRTYAERPDLAGAVTILFPEDVRDPATWHQFGEFGVHHMAGSWRKPESFWSLRLTRLWEGWTLWRLLSTCRPNQQATSPGSTDLIPLLSERHGSNKHA
jgi:mannosyltransferase OCH1-like enzyme